MITAEQLQRQLNLKPHPEEGGYFVETYRSDEHIPQNALPNRYEGDRSFATAIYYLLTSDTLSAMHRLPTDEIFHFYMGDPVEMLQLMPDGSGRVITLGNDILKGMLSASCSAERSMSGIEAHPRREIRPVGRDDCAGN